MAKTVIVKLVDDLDGGEADETVLFSLDGRSFEIDLSASNANRLRETFRPYIDRARSASGRGPVTKAKPGGKTLFASLDSEEKDRFRVWASLPNARRIADQRVRDWMEAGRL